MPQHDTPLALLGYPADAARKLRDLGLTALSLPTEPLAKVLDACAPLAFTGALVAPALQAAVLAASQPDSAARRAGAADALSFAGGLHSTHTLPDALLDALEQSGYPVRGAHALIIGERGDLGAGLALTRLGLGSLTLAAASHPDGEHLLKDLPRGVRAHATTRHDSALPTLAERADLIVLTAGMMPPGVLQPFHALLDLTGRAGSTATRAGASLVPLGQLPELRLSRRLLHATGQRFAPDALSELAGLF
ncbi:shikimate dehydrogenase [Deinococcus ruber]|uniref:Shikimate dehydrogenase n=1 Tax=Deinococcus ruber TaxID=1848197 RepID=A0A918FGG2_9DEIO|nr:shikimate dehydrogenase [Deinococcus ruber]GGR36252.1 hypothetical protein GCM10008957_52490 [Deinococcus ruber]